VHDEDTYPPVYLRRPLEPVSLAAGLFSCGNTDRAFDPFTSRALDIVEHLATAPAVSPNNVAVAATLQLIDVLAPRHTAIANQNDTLAPEAILQIAHDSRYGRTLVHAHCCGFGGLSNRAFAEFLRLPTKKGASTEERETPEDNRGDPSGQYPPFAYQHGEAAPRRLRSSSRVGRRRRRHIAQELIAAMTLDRR
jgi:hypothetical protein